MISDKQLFSRLSRWTFPLLLVAAIPLACLPVHGQGQQTPPASDSQDASETVNCSARSDIVVAVKTGPDHVFLAAITQERASSGDDENTHVAWLAVPGGEDAKVRIRIGQVLRIGDTSAVIEGMKEREVLLKVNGKLLEWMLGTSFAALLSDKAGPHGEGPQHTGRIISHVHRYGLGTRTEAILNREGSMVSGFDCHDAGTLDWTSDVNWCFIRRHEGNDLWLVETIFQIDNGTDTKRKRIVSFDGRQAVRVVHEPWQMISIEPTNDKVEPTVYDGQVPRPYYPNAMPNGRASADEAKTTTSMAKRHVTSSRPSWEYKVIDVMKTIDAARETNETAVPHEEHLGSQHPRVVRRGPDRDETGVSLEERLNSLGNDGWELCEEVHGHMIFKRNVSGSRKRPPAIDPGMGGLSRNVVEPSAGGIGRLTSPGGDAERPSPVGLNSLVTVIIDTPSGTASEGKPQVDGEQNDQQHPKTSLETHEPDKCRVACRVVEVRPNSTLIIEGHRRTPRNGIMEELALSGEIRLEAIRPDNTVFSEDVAELRITHKLSILPVARQAASGKPGTPSFNI